MLSHPVDAMVKFDLLVHILKKIQNESTIIFFQTKAGADRIAKWLQQHGNNDIAVMHSNLNQRERAKALQDFKDGNISTLIATDIASRGLDVRGVQHVINYDVPQHSEGSAEQEEQKLKVMPTLSSLLTKWIKSKLLRR